MTSEQPITPDAIEPPASTEGARSGEPPPGAGLPTKLIRIASMTRAMLEEVRHAPLDEQGKARLAAVHSRSLDELREMLPPDLLEEFNEIMVPLHVETPSEAELRIAQAQLIGWLEGLFHGIQASLFTQQMAAQAQLQEMARRSAISRGPQEGEQGSGLVPLGPSPTFWREEPALRCGFFAPERIRDRGPTRPCGPRSVGGGPDGAHALTSRPRCRTSHPGRWRSPDTPP